LADVLCIDFLPVRCDACGREFCADHYFYDAHHCEDSVIQRICLSQDVQVPICPLCGKAVPVARDELPDEPMNRHIETGSQSSRGQIYKHRCAVKTCRRRELVPMRCEKCGLNFCLSHRFPADHDCGNQTCSSKISLAG
ncbi:unnamed protein product, partial [Enterobius vermicularis]|uniref:AN1-type domain-containing protein n=1 Tax=Enterobius vermicularis TaxID=51028 RepID=A0A0N4VEB9_ENTVE